MRNKINIILCILFAGLLIAAFVDPFELMQVYTFTGIGGDRAPANALTTVRELVNGDIIYRTGRQLIKQRAGFTKLGDTLEDGPISGIFRYNPGFDDAELIAVSGRNFYRYSTYLDKWVTTSQDISTSTVHLTNGSNMMYGGDLFWKMGQYHPTDCDIDGSTYDINYILRDSMIALDADWGDTTGYYSMTLNITNKTTGITDFIDNFSYPAFGIMFNDTLIVTVKGQRFLYSLSQTGDVDYDAQTDAANLTRYYDQIRGQYTIFKADPIDNFSAGDFLYIHQYLGHVDSVINLPLYCVEYRPVSRQYRCRIDSLVLARLSGNGTGVTDRFYLDRFPASDISAPTTMFSGTIDSVEIDSFQVPYHSTDWFYHHIIYSTTTADAPELWPEDTLNWGYYYCPEAEDSLYPVSVNTVNGNTVIRVFTRATPVANGEHLLEDGDTFTIRRMTDRFSADTLNMNPIDTATWNSEITALVNNRLYYAGDDDDPSEVFYLAEYCVDSSGNVAGAVIVNEDDGDEVTALVPYNRDVTIFKKRSVYAGIVSAYDNTIDEIIKVDCPTGVPSQWAVKEYGGLIYFVSPPHGLFAFDGSRAVNISGPVAFYFSDSIRAETEENIRLEAGIDVTIGTPAIYISYTSINGTENDRTLRFDLETQQWSKYTNFGASAFGLLRGGTGYGDTLLIGTPVSGDSYVLKFPSSTKDTAEYIDMQILTGFSDFGMVWHNKSWLEFVPIFTAAANSKIISHWYLDWSSSSTDSDTIWASAGWQAPRRGLSAIQGQSVAFLIELDSAENVEVLGVEVLYEDAGRIGD